MRETSQGELKSYVDCDGDQNAKVAKIEIGTVVRISMLSMDNVHEK
jgi:hypothetical protein